MDIKAIVDATLVAPMRVLCAEDRAKHAEAWLQVARDRVSILESALTLLLHFVDESRSDSEGHYPALVSGCNECTQGATPDKYNTGLCPYHLAQRVLKRDAK